MQSLLQNESLDKHALKPWYSLGRPSRAFLVRGEPWMEDMNRFPSREIRVDFEGSEVRPTLPLVVVVVGALEDRA